MKTPSQPRAIYYIVAIQIWEYFSFYGMRALLILYLTHQLGFDDNHAISLFSAYASLVYVTPILGGWLADRLLGNRTAVIAGALLMTLGHVVLGIDTNSTFSLYLALAIVFVATVYSNQTSAVCLASSTTRTIIDVMAVFAAVCCGQYRFYRSPNRLRPGCSVVWMACWLCPCGWRHVYRFVDFLKRSSSFPVHT